MLKNRVWQPRKTVLEKVNICIASLTPLKRGIYFLYHDAGKRKWMQITVNDSDKDLVSLTFLDFSGTDFIDDRGLVARLYLL